MGAKTCLAITQVLATVVLLGCATPATSPDFVAQWQGKSKDEAIAALGPPTQSKPLPDGGSLLTWERVQRHASGIGRMHNAEAYYTRCRMELQADPTGIIRTGTQTC